MQRSVWYANKNNSYRNNNNIFAMDLDGEVYFPSISMCVYCDSNKNNNTQK